MGREGKLNGYKSEIISSNSLCSKRLVRKICITISAVLRIGGTKISISSCLSRDPRHDPIFPNPPRSMSTSPTAILFFDSNNFDNILYDTRDSLCEFRKSNLGKEIPTNHHLTSFYAPTKPN